MTEVGAAAGGGDPVAADGFGGAARPGVDDDRDSLRGSVHALVDAAPRLVAEQVERPAPGPPETGTAYQAIVDAFNQYPGQVFRARELHELLGMPTDKTFVNITRSRLGRLTRQGFLTQPGRGRYQKRT
ncbi:hypothetical protein [Streptomyces sp. 2323.1]|uniref:hypothetical protein n=1 Tax=Streptomyces sp. 2323.1 TaxID=1938841 RepID=UPI0013317EAE|nr:hypothetical protein [Streptomyces sp. 2323.1]